jgi:hypothetical protein
MEHQNLGRLTSTSKTAWSIAEIEGQLDYLEDQLQGEDTGSVSLPTEGAAGSHGNYPTKSTLTPSNKVALRQSIVPYGYPVVRSSHCFWRFFRRRQSTTWGAIYPRGCRVSR